MVFLYDLGLLLYTLLLRIASIKNKKAKQWLAGRKNILDHVSRTVDASPKSTWFHFASLGEFEQGRPVLEHLKRLKPNVNLIITFFSPSGYEIRKNYPLATHIFYLPLDTPRNAEQFIRLINPEVAVFTKYEYWYHYFKILKRNDIPLFLISTIFRKEQVFFQWYGGLHRQMLTFVTEFFVQNQQSKVLLEGLGVKNATVSGDTRFDRVYENACEARKLPIVEKFTEGSRVLVCGSTWPDDEALLASLATRNPEWKFIIAPHEINEDKMRSISKSFAAVRYSQISSLPAEKITSDFMNSQTLIIDNIGMLSALYRYGDLAYIGGGFGAGIHNTLEAAAFGIPVIFGPKYEKFQEARDLLTCGAGFAISGQKELDHIFDALQSEDHRRKAGLAAETYVSENRGATEIIVKRVLGAASS